MKKLNLFYRAANKASFKLRGKIEFLSLFFMKIYFFGIQRFLKKNFSYLLKNEEPLVPPVKELLPEEKNTIWVCWFQGEKAAPEIVQKCIQSIRRAAPPSARVVVLDEENLLDYAKIPESVVQKYKAGLITRTCFSDVLRFALLSQRGGSWLDSTVFCAKKIPESLFKSELYSIKNSNYDRHNIARRRWSAYFWFCKRGSYFAARVFEFFCAYWEKYDFLIDYFLIDHIINFLYENDSKCRALLDAIPSNNPAVSFLQERLSKPFDQSEYDELLKDTTFFKLNWKAEFKESEGCFYERIF